MDMDGLRRARVPVALLLAMAGVLIASYGYGPQERALPVLVAWTTIALLVLEVLVQAGTPAGRRIDRLLQGKNAGPGPEPERAPPLTVLIHAVGWPGLLVAMTVLIGILPAVLVYVFFSLKVAGGKSLKQALVIAVALTGLSWLLFEWTMSYRLFRGVLMGYYGAG